MKIFGWEDAGVLRGDMVFTTVDSIDMDSGLEAVAKKSGLAVVRTSFTEARKELVCEMKKEGADPELIVLVKSMKASDVPLLEFEC